MFHNSRDGIFHSKGKVVYIAVCISPQVLDQALLRQKQILQTYNEVSTITKAENQNNKLDIKNEFHCTLQFFSPPREVYHLLADDLESTTSSNNSGGAASASSPSDNKVSTPTSNTNNNNLNDDDKNTISKSNSSSNPHQDRETLSLLSLIGANVKMSVSYVAFTSKIIAARLNILNPTPVALACANSCPHITLAVGTNGQAVWSNELLCYLENKNVPPASERDVKSGAYQKRVDELWSKAKVVSFGPGGGENGNHNQNEIIFNSPESLIVDGQVCAFVQVPKSKNTVSPRLMSPSTLSPANHIANPEQQQGNSRSTTPTNRGGGGSRISPTRGTNLPGRSSPSSYSSYSNQNNNNNPYTEVNTSSSVARRGSAMTSASRGRGGAVSSAQQNANNNNEYFDDNNNNNNESPMRRETTLPG